MRRKNFTKVNIETSVKVKTASTTKTKASGKIGNPSHSSHGKGGNVGVSPRKAPCH